MFIRLKKIQGKHYAYNVQNKRVRGKVKQKVKSYIGKAIIPKKTNEKDFFEFIRKDVSSYNKNIKETVEDLIKWELFKHDLKDIKIDIKKYSITKDNEKIVIKLNEGYLYDKTVRNIIKFHAVGDDEYFIGKSLQKSLSKQELIYPKSFSSNYFKRSLSGWDTHKLRINNGEEESI